MIRYANPCGAPTIEVGAEWPGARRARYSADRPDGGRFTGTGEVPADSSSVAFEPRIRSIVVGWSAPPQRGAPPFYRT